MKDNYKIIVAHAEKQHSFYLAAAMKRKGYLYKYITTIYDKPKSLTNRIKRFLRGTTLKKAEGRSSNLFEERDVLQFNELFNLFITFLARYPRCRELCRTLRYLNGFNFGVKVAKYAVKHDVDAVILFDTYAHSCFEYLKKKHSKIKCILDVTIISRPYTREVFDKMSELTGDFKLKEENRFIYDDKFMRSYKKEFQYGDLFLAASDMVARSIEYCGVNKGKIALNPYGVNIEKFQAVPNDTVYKPLRMIVVGQLNRRKGIHQLLHVVSEYDESEIFLDLVGGYDEKSDIYKKYKDLSNVYFHGYITHDTLYKLYQSSHIFVLPSFAEGMALVGLEALASGLPVLCSDYSGVNDLIVPYENGIVVRAGHEEDLKAGIDWFIRHSTEIPRMSRSARQTAENYTWEIYYSRTGDIITNFMKAKESRQNGTADLNN